MVGTRMASSGCVITNSARLGLRTGTLVDTSRTAKPPAKPVAGSLMASRFSKISDISHLRLTSPKGGDNVGYLHGEMNMSTRYDWIEIDEAYFTIAELAKVAGIARGIADVWAHRGILPVSRFDRSTARRRPLFSVRTILKAALIRMLSNDFSLGPTDTAKLVANSDSSEVADMLAGEDWMQAVKRSQHRPQVLDLSLAVGRPGKNWRWFLFASKEGVVEPFGRGIPHIVVPASSIFVQVITDCTAIYLDEPMRSSSKARRGRS